MKNTHYIGKAGEHAVASQLLLREVPVQFPVVDVGVDLFAGAKATVRIQVKSVHSRRNRRDGYCFTLASRVRLNGEKNYRLKVKDWTKEADFLVLWGIEENRFWVLPTRLLAGKKVQGLLVGSTGHRKQVDHARILSLYATGMTQSAVAREMGLSAMCVSECVRGKTYGTYADQACVDADKYLNAWHEIEAAVKLANEIDDIDPLSVLSPSEIEQNRSALRRTF